MESAASSSLFLVQVRAPCGATQQLEFSSRCTVDFVKSKIFATCDSLKHEIPGLYVLQLVETKETLFVEFLKFLATSGMQKSAEDGIPILVELIMRDRIYNRSKSALRISGLIQMNPLRKKPFHITPSSQAQPKEEGDITLLPTEIPIKEIQSEEEEKEISRIIDAPEIQETTTTTWKESMHLDSKTVIEEQQVDEEEIEELRIPKILQCDLETVCEGSSDASPQESENEETSNEEENAVATIQHIPKPLLITRCNSDRNPSPIRTSMFSIGGNTCQAERRVHKSNGLFGSHRHTIHDPDAIRNKKNSVGFADELRADSPTKAKRKSTPGRPRGDVISRRRRSSIDMPSTVFIRQNHSNRLSSVQSLTQSPDQSRLKGLNAQLNEECLQVSKMISLPPVQSTIIDQWAHESESELIEPEQFGFYTQVGNQALPVDKFTKELFTVDIPLQENLFRKYFVANEHENHIGLIDKIGPIIISLVEDKLNRTIRALVRTSEKTSHVCLNYKGSGSYRFKKVSEKKIRDILSEISISLPRKALKKVKKAELSSSLLSYDDSHLVSKFKFGVLYCEHGQTTEDEWFGNEDGSPAFDTFLSLLGDRVPLKGWSKFRAGLDTKTGATGQESVYLEYQGNEVMFHVSTMLPYDQADEQKIERKRHLGNDIAVIIFMDGETKFPPAICKSVYNHVYIVVREDKNETDHYVVGVTIKDGVKPFGPGFPFPPRIHKSLLRDFLITKLLNAEWAAYKSIEFSHKFKRTRKQQLTAIFNEFSN